MRENKYNYKNQTNFVSFLLDKTVSSTYQDICHKIFIRLNLIFSVQAVILFSIRYQVR